MIAVEHAHDGAKVEVQSAQGLRQGVVCEVAALWERVQGK